MAQGGYQQLAKEVMSNGGSMQDAGRLWQAAGKNLQRAQQMLRKGGNNKRNMRGGESVPDVAGEEASDPKPEDAMNEEQNKVDELKAKYRKDFAKGLITKKELL